MQSALANTVDLSPQAQQAIKLETFAKLVQQLVSQVQPTRVDMPASWPAGGVTPQMQQLLSALLQQFTAQQPLPQQLVSVQSWSAQLTQAVLQHAGASAATAQTSTAAGSATAHTAQRPAGSAPLPPLQNWLVQQGSIQAADGERAFTLTLRVPAAWAQAQPTLAAALPGALTGTPTPGTGLPPLAFAGSVQQLASGSFGLVMQPQAIPGSAAAVAAQAMRTSAILQLEFQPLAQAMQSAQAASVYMPAAMLPQDVQAALEKARAEEPWPLAKNTLDLLWSNLGAAKEKDLPICQDTGMACVFVELGTDVHIDGSFEAAIHEGVRRGYTDGYLRKSIVADPLRRGNTGDNTPAAITVHLVDGEGCRITVAPKGFGSENMSRIQMLKPADGVEGFKKFVVDTVKQAGSNPCPPIVLGIGVGGSFDKVAYLAKKALLRPLDIPNPDPYYAQLEQELLAAINALGIGPQGFGGKTTCLGLAIEQMPTHVAGLPVAVNVSCHVTRRASAEL